MTQRVLVALFTVLVFLAGYGARIWTEPRQSVPPAPQALAQEYARASSSSKKRAETDRAKLVAEIEKLRPEIEVYRARVDEIYAEFDREFTKILTPAQRAKHEANVKKKSEHDMKRRVKMESERAPMTEEEIMRERDRPMTDVYRMIAVTPRLEYFTKEYGLTPEQQASARALLTLRRTKCIALLDATPPPSIQLSRLAPYIHRMAAKPAK